MAMVQTTHHPSIEEAVKRETAVEVFHLFKTFQKRKSTRRLWGGETTKVVAVENVTFEVKRREIYGILGPNGSGKSTLIRMLSTLLVPDHGEVTIFGMDLQRDEAAIRRLLNRVSVDAAFYKKLSPRENLLYSARLYGLPPKEADEKSQQILKRLGLRKKAYFEPLEEMSRGMQQKVAIARAFLTAPILLLLDEPTTGLDPKSRRDVQEFVLDLREIHDATILLTTHDMPEAERLCDRISFINHGKIVAEGTSETLKAQVGKDASLEDAFIELTGETWDDEDDE
jgi:ABC-2 type transport system ATP-binding protein